ncbi:hypothetical protein [Hyphomicrobium sp. DY-1]|uniref:hypothetical protein n=1 Tax=Hyphomicrobium sp. DY-1 TaxID=3075650 RepID=UPI0039C00D0C
MDQQLKDEARSRRLELLAIKKTSNSRFVRWLCDKFMDLALWLEREAKWMDSHD